MHVQFTGAYKRQTLPLMWAGQAAEKSAAMRPSATLSADELRRLVATMID